MPTEIRNSQVPEEKKEEKATLIQPRDPHGRWGKMLPLDVILQKQMVDWQKYEIKCSSLDSQNQRNKQILK